MHLWQVRGQEGSNLDEEHPRDGRPNVTAESPRATTPPPREEGADDSGMGQPPLRNVGLADSPDAEEALPVEPVMECDSPPAEENVPAPLGMEQRQVADDEGDLLAVHAPPVVRGSSGRPRVRGARDRDRQPIGQAGRRNPRKGSSSEWVWLGFAAFGMIALSLLAMRARANRALAASLSGLPGIPPAQGPPRLRPDIVCPSCGQGSSSESWEIGPPYRCPICNVTFDATGCVLLPGNRGRIGAEYAHVAARML